jgi:hypothetical protein
VIDPAHELVFPQLIWHEPGPSQAIVLLQESVPAQLIVQPVPPHAIGPLHEVVPVQSIEHELASRQSTPPVQPFDPHETWHGAPAGQTTRAAHAPACVQSNEHTPPSTHVAPIGHDGEQTATASPVPASTGPASGIARPSGAPSVPPSSGPSATSMASVPGVESVVIVVPSAPRPAS